MAYLNNLILIGAAALIASCTTIPEPVDEPEAPTVAVAGTAPIAETIAPATPPPPGPPRGGHTAPPEQADVSPVNEELPNPYIREVNFGSLPDGRTWGAVTAMDMAPDGKHLWVAERCGANSCAGSDLDPVVMLSPEGEPLISFGGDLIMWPHGMDVDGDGNVWVTDARAATEAELAKFPDDANKGHAVFKFSPEGELLMVLGTPGTSGNPPERLYEPNDVLVAPDGSIFVAEGHRAQFVDGDGAGNPDAFGRISKFAPDGSFIKSWGQFGYEDGEFRTPHALTLDGAGRLLVGDRGNRRIQVFDLDGNHLDTWYNFSRSSGLAVDGYNTLYSVDSESGELNNPGWRRGLRIGSAASGDVHFFVPEHFITGQVGPGNGTGAMGEGVTVAADGTVYTGEIGPDHLRGISRFSPVLGPRIQ